MLFVFNIFASGQAEQFFTDRTDGQLLYSTVQLLTACNQTGFPLLLFGLHLNFLASAFQYLLWVGSDRFGVASCSCFECGPWKNDGSTQAQQMSENKVPLKLKKKGTKQN